MKRRLSEFLDDILQAILDIERFTKGLDLERFRTNREKILAVVKLLEIVGEATKQIPEEIRQQHPSIPWKAIAGMRDILVHVYWDINTEVIWATVRENLPALKIAIEAIRRNIDDVENPAKEN